MTLKIPPRHNGVVPIRITGQAIKEHRAYFITDENSTKGRDPNINVIDGIKSIKGKTSVNILVSNYMNKHIKFNKEEYVGGFKSAIEDMNNDAKQITHLTYSVTTQHMKAEQVEPDTFHPTHHKLKPIIETKLDALLKEYTSQFAKKC